MLVREERTNLPPSSSVCLIPESLPSRLFVISAVPLVSILGLWRASVTFVGSLCFPCGLCLIGEKSQFILGTLVLYVSGGQCKFRVWNFYTSFKCLVSTL